MTRSLLETLNDVARSISELGENRRLSMEDARVQLIRLLSPLLPEGAQSAILARDAASPEAIITPLTPDLVLAITLPAGYPWSAEEQAAVENAALHAAVALARVQDAARMQQSLHRKEEELERLRRADMLISSRLGLEETLEAILQMALDVTGARYGIFRLVDDQGRLATRAFAGDDLGHPHTEALPLDASTITGQAALARKTLCIEDVRNPAWHDLYYPLDKDMKMRSELVTPLIGAGGRLEGILNLESPEVSAFSDDDALLLQSLAIQAVIAIQEVRLLDALQDLSARLLTQPPAAVYDRVVQLARELLGAPVAGLWTLSQGEPVLLAASPSGMTRTQTMTGILKEAMSSRHPRHIILNDSDGLIAPMLSGTGGQMIGLLGVFGAPDARLPASDWDKKVLALLARHGALAADNARRQEALRVAREQQTAAETFAAMGDIAANLLHRLNNKLGLIPVRIEGVEDKRASLLASDPYLARNLESIRISAVEALDIVRESLAYLRPITLTSASIPEAVEHALAEIQAPAGIHIVREGLDELPRVVAGRRRLALVFHNLLENAIAAMPEEGLITIIGEPTEDGVQVTVQDTGPGIPPHLHDEIFQFDFSGRRSSGKLGFGLWWVKTIMARFGGSVSVRSDGQHGAAFILRFLLADPADLDGGEE